MPMLGLTEMVKAVLLESQCPGTECAVCEKSDETRSWKSKAVMPFDGLKAPNPDHSPVRTSKGTNGTPKSV